MIISLMQRPKMGNQSTVLAYLQGKGMVITSSPAANIRVSFSRLKLCLIVSICRERPSSPKQRSAQVLLSDLVDSSDISHFMNGV